MKKSLIALAALAATGLVSAQSSVTIDGRIDLGVVKVKGAGAKLDVTNGGNQLRFRGSEDLGGGLKANFALAQRFSPESGNNDGSNNGRPTFQGESTVGLSGGFGSMKIGRSLTAFQGPVASTDPWGTLTQASTHVLTGAYSTDPVADGVLNSGGLGRTDAVSYSSPVIGGFSISASYGFKNSAAAPTAAAADRATNTKDLTSVWLSYAAGPIMVGGGTEQNRRGDKVTAILGTYNLGVARVGAGTSSWDVAATTGAKGKAYNLMASVPMGAITGNLGYSNSKAENTGAKTTKLGIGATYAFSKRTNLYSTYGNSKLNTTGVRTTGFDLGIVHTF